MKNTPDGKVHGANMGSTWGQQAPGGPHVGLMDLAIWDLIACSWGQFMQFLLWLEKNFIMLKGNHNVISNTISDMKYLYFDPENNT